MSAFDAVMVTVDWLICPPPNYVLSRVLIGCELVFSGAVSLKSEQVGVSETDVFVFIPSSCR